MMSGNQIGAMGGGLLGAGLGQFLGNWQNPVNQAGNTLNQIPGQMGQYYNPYISAGNQALPQLQQQYNQLLGGLPDLQQQYGNAMSNPGGVYNQIQSGYQQSPGFQFALKQALAGSNNANAAGGMAGSPMAQQQNMQVASGLASQDFNNYMQNALGVYGMGLQGEQGLYNEGLGGLGGLGQLGYNASNEMANNLGQSLLSKSMLQYAGQNAQNQNQGSMWGALGGGLGSLLGAFPGQIGSAIGSFL
jgi:hypothetical protein